MKDPRPTQALLPGDFSPFDPYRAPGVRPPVKLVVRRVVHVHLSAEEERMARKRAHEQVELDKTQEFKRLVAGGMSRVDAGRKVYP